MKVKDRGEGESIPYTTPTRPHHRTQVISYVSYIRVYHQPRRQAMARQSSSRCARATRLTKPPRRSVCRCCPQGCSAPAVLVCFPRRGCVYYRSCVCTWMMRSLLSAATQATALQQAANVVAREVKNRDIYMHNKHSCRSSEEHRKTRGRPEIRNEPY